VARRRGRRDAGEENAIATVRINPRLEAEVTGHLAEHGQMERVLGGYADQIALVAQRIARAEFYGRGGYARGIHGESGVDEHGQIVGRVVATDWKSHWAERGWGDRTGGKRARHILARAATQVGFRVLAGQATGPIGGAVARRAIGGPSRGMLGGGRQRAITGRG
jgi:hypothetical protein